MNKRMANKVRGIPENSSHIIPRLVCRNAVAEIDFCLATFEAVEHNRRMSPDHSMVHALLTIGNEMIMIESEWPNLPSRAPNPDGSSPVVIFVYVEDVDKTTERAMLNGGTLIIQPQNQFWGDRIAWIMDPAGHVWTIATRIEETTAGERSERWDAMKKGDA
jgi:PhnB protein